MGRFIIHHEGWFFEWSEIVDAPVSEAMRRPEFEAYYRDRHGSIGMQGLPQRLERAIKFGCSSFNHQSAQDVISCNRAGPDERELSFEEVLAAVGIETTPPLPARP